MDLNISAFFFQPKNIFSLLCNNEVLRNYYFFLIYFITIIYTYNDNKQYVTNYTKSRK